MKPKFNRRDKYVYGFLPTGNCIYGKEYEQDCTRYIMPVNLSSIKQTVKIHNADPSRYKIYIFKLERVK